MQDGTQRTLEWLSDTGAVVLGGNDVLAIVNNEDDLRRQLSGWADHCELRNGLSWVAAQLLGCK
jgi:hypothetical protein